MARIVTCRRFSKTRSLHRFVRVWRSLCAALLLSFAVGAATAQPAETSFDAEAWSETAARAARKTRAVLDGAEAG